MSLFRRQTCALALLAATTTACTDDPIYVEPNGSIEVGADMAGGGTAAGQVLLPIRLERDSEAVDRADLAAELGAEVPFVTRDDLDISVEWTLTNLDDTASVARIQLNGANEWFAYVPSAFVVDPEEEEEPPPLVGNVPMDIGPNEIRSGVFREDQLAEAAIDLELITRGALNPFAAILERHKDVATVDLAGVEFPVDRLAHLIRIDLTLISNRHTTLAYTVRVRDHRSPNLLHDELSNAPTDELTAFAPADFAPPAP